MDQYYRQLERQYKAELSKEAFLKLAAATIRSSGLGDQFEELLVDYYIHLLKEGDEILIIKDYYPIENMAGLSEAEVKKRKALMDKYGNIQKKPILIRGVVLSIEGEEDEEYMILRTPKGEEIEIDPENDEAAMYSIFPVELAAEAYKLLDAHKKTLGF